MTRHHHNKPRFAPSPRDWMARHFFRALLVLLVLLRFAATSPVLALDASKAAENMARQAATAFEQGDHLRAAQLYLQAWSTDRNVPDYVYGAARAEHVGGKLEIAERHYSEFLALVTSGKRAENARRFLAELRGAKADEKVMDADKATRQGNWPLASQQYHAAYELAPNRTELLFREAAAREAAGDKTTAAELYDKFLKTAPSTAADRDEAKVRLASLRGGGPAAKASPAADPAPTSSVVVQSPPAVKPAAAASAVELPAGGVAARADVHESRTLAWSLLLGGGAVVLAGTGTAIAAAVSQSNLTKATQTLDPSTGLVSGISYTEAQSQTASIRNLHLTAAIVGGVGVVTMATGAWLLWMVPQANRPVAVGILPNRIEAAWQF